MTDSKLTKSNAALQTDIRTDRRNTAVTSSSFYGNSEVKPGRLWLAGRPGRVVPCRRVWRGSPGRWCHQRYWNQDQGSSLFSHTTREWGGGEKERQKRNKDKWKWNTKIITIARQTQSRQTTSTTVEGCFHGMCDTFWQLYWRSSILWQQQWSHKYPCQSFSIWHNESHLILRKREKPNPAGRSADLGGVNDFMFPT